MHANVRCLLGAVALACGVAHAADPGTQGGASPQASKVVASVPLTNPGFESTAPFKLGAPDGWWTIQHAGPASYAFSLDATVRKTGERSLRVENVGPEPFGTIFQVLATERWRGKTLRFSGWIRTENARGNQYGRGAGLNLHSMRGGYVLSFAQMRKDAVNGTTDWARYEVTLAVPNDADRLEAGLTLFGPGIAWLDDALLEVVEPAAPAEAATVPRVSRQP